MWDKLAVITTDGAAKGRVDMYAVVLNSGQELYTLGGNILEAYDNVLGLVGDKCATSVQAIWRVK